MADTNEHNPDQNHSHDDHGHTHGHDHNHDHQDPFHVHPGSPLIESELDPATRSLNDALKISFGVLKLVMVGLIFYFIFSGIRPVPENHVAVRLRFGQVVGKDSAAVLEPGWHITFPEPIERIVKINTMVQDLDINRSFWFNFHKKDQMKSLDELEMEYAANLVPGRDGSMMTGDRNLVHAKWTIQWQVRKVDAVDFLRNVSDDDAIDEQSKQPRMIIVANEFIANVAEQALVRVVAQTTAEEFLRGKVDRDKIRLTIQNSLDQLKAGIKISKVNLTISTPPMSVREAFRMLTDAQSEKAKKIEAAQQEASKILSASAGSGYDLLLNAIGDYERSRMKMDEKRRDAMALLQQYMLVKSNPAKQNEATRLHTQYQTMRQGFQQQLTKDKPQIEAAYRNVARLMESEQVSGNVSRMIAEAVTYKQSVEQVVSREASNYLTYREMFERDPALRSITIDRLWEDARQEILAGDVETFYLPKDVKEIRLDLSRDPKVINKRDQDRRKELIEKAAAEAAAGGSN